MTEYLVLDHGYVKFIDSMGTDETVIEAARMSTGKGFVSWENYSQCDECRAFSTISTLTVVHEFTCQSRKDKSVTGGDSKLLEFLYKNQHHTPFEMCELALEVQAPIFVFREWMRHRTQSFNEFSARYAQMPNLHYLPELSRFQRQSATNKQGSAEELPEKTADQMHFYLRTEQEQVYNNYDEMIKAGLSKEVARINTPVSRYSKMRVKTDLRNWLGFLKLRMAPNAQFEIRMFANAVAVIVKELWPRTYALFLEYDLNSVRLSATEQIALREHVLRLEDSDLNYDRSTPETDAILSMFQRAKRA